MLAFLKPNLVTTMPFSPPETAIKNIWKVTDHLNLIWPTVYRPVGDKQISAFKVEGSWRSSKANVKAWIGDQNQLKKAI